MYLSFLGLVRIANIAIIDIVINPITITVVVSLESSETTLAVIEGLLIKKTAAPKRSIKVTPNSPHPFLIVL